MEGSGLFCQPISQMCVCVEAKNSPKIRDKHEKVFREVCECASCFECADDSGLQLPAVRQRKSVNEDLSDDSDDLFSIKVQKLF